MVFVLVLIIIGVGVNSTFLSSRQEYEVIYTNLSIVEAQKIIKKLEADNIQWKHDPKKGTVSIESRYVQMFQDENID